MKKVFVVGTQSWYADYLRNIAIVNNIENADYVLFTGGEDINPDIYNCEAHESTYFTRRRDKQELDAFKCIREDQFVLGTCRGLQLLCALYGGLLVQDVNNHGLWGTHPMYNKDGDEFQITSLHHQMAYPWTINPDHYDVLFDTPHRSITEIYLSYDVEEHYLNHEYDFMVHENGLHKTIQELLNSNELKFDKSGSPFITNFHYEGDKIDLDVIKQHDDPEVIYFHTPGMPQALGIQGHPEMMDFRSETVVMLNDLIDKLSNN